MEKVSFFLQKVSDKNTTSKFRQVIALHLNFWFSGYLSLFQPPTFQAPIFNRLFGICWFIFSVKSEKVSTGDVLLRFKQLPWLDDIEVPGVDVVGDVERLDVELDPTS